MLVLCKSTIRYFVVRAKRRAHLIKQKGVVISTTTSSDDETRPQSRQADGVESVVTDQAVVDGGTDTLPVVKVEDTIQTYDYRLHAKMLYLQKTYRFLAEGASTATVVYGDTCSPLSTVAAYPTLARNFVKLYDSYAYHPNIFTGHWTSLFNNNINPGIDVRRTRARFLTRFMIHGHKERLLRANGVALAYLFLTYQNTLYPMDFLISGGLEELYIFSGTRLYFGTRHRYTRKLFRQRRPTGFVPSMRSAAAINLFLRNLNLSMESTAVAQRNMSDFAPAFTFFITRMSKKAYKATRGRLGRYTVKTGKLHHSRSLPYMYTQLKTQFLVSEKATFIERLTEVLQCAYFMPEQTLGSVLGELAEAEENW